MKNNKFIMCAVAAAFGILAAAPLSAQAEDAETGDVSSVKSGEASAGTLSWFTDESGRIFYYGEDGSFVTGEQEIDGEKYLFSANGVLKTGWRTVDGKRRYYDTETGKPVYGWFEYCGKSYYIDPDDGKLSGYFSDSENSAYILSDKGDIVTEEGLTKVDDSIYYVSDDSTLLRGEAEIDGITYSFGTDGKMQTGLVIASNGEIHYFDEDGTVKKGWIETDGKKYFFNPDGSVPGEGWWKISGNTYYFGGEGFALSGLQEINGKKYYFGEDCIVAVGWQEIDGNTYYFNPSGYSALTGVQQIDSASYRFSDEGVLLENIVLGWNEVDGKKYYIKSDGSFVTGFVKIGSMKYYFNDEGIMQTGWQEINGNKYYFTNAGYMAVGRMTIDGKNYYFEDSGLLYTGWDTYDGYKYFYDDDGTMLQNGFWKIDGNTYYFTSTGAMYTGWLKTTKGKCYFNSDGAMLTQGWWTIDGDRYYVQSSGMVLTDTTYDGYTFDENGVATLAPKLSAVEQRAQSILNTSGKSLDNIYNYVRNHNAYRYIEATRTLASINSTGWSYFANYAMDNTYVVCYYFAAITDVLFKQAGYESRIVYGTGRGTGDHYWNQVYVNGIWTNYDTCNGYKNVTFEYLQTQNYTFYQYVYPTYN